MIEDDWLYTASVAVVMTPHDWAAVVACLYVSGHPERHQLANRIASAVDAESGDDDEARPSF